MTMIKTPFGEYTYEQLEKAFDKVADPGDWKAPIYKRIMRSEVAITFAAVEFFTATMLIVTQDIPGRPDVTVQAMGYRAGPAGDH